MNIKMEFFSFESLKILQNAHKIAQDLRFENVGTDHLLLAFCEKNDFFKALKLDSLDIKFEIYKLIGLGNSTTAPSSYTPKAKRIVENSLDEVPSFKNSSVEPIHIFISLLKETDCVSYAAFENLGIDINSLIENCIQLSKKELFI